MSKFLEALYQLLSTFLCEATEILPVLLNVNIFSFNYPTKVYTNTVLHYNENIDIFILPLLFSNPLSPLEKNLTAHPRSLQYADLIKGRLFLLFQELAITL